MTDTKKSPGRPRKAPKAEDKMEETVEETAVESTEDVAEAAHEPTEATEPTKTSKTGKDLTAMVDRLMELVRGFTPTFNRKQRVSVVNLGSKPVTQGVKYRQLFVEETPGMMVITMFEGFKSNHGGADTKDKLNSFSVPVSDPELYSRVHNRFFGYQPRKNLNDASLLLDKLEQTVRT